MTMLMQIAFEVLQRLIERPVANAGVGGHAVIRRQGAQLAQDISSSVMFPHHHAHGIVDRSKRSKRNSPWTISCFCQRHYVEEEYLLCLEHVGLQIGAKEHKELVEMDELGVITSMRGEHFVGQPLKPVQFGFGEYMVHV